MHMHIEKILACYLYVFNKQSGWKIERRKKSKITFLIYLICFKSTFEKYENCKWFVYHYFDKVLIIII